MQKRGIVRKMNRRQQAGLAVFWGGKDAGSWWKEAEQWLIQEQRGGWGRCKAVR